MEFHTIRGISVSSLNVYYVQTCNVIHQKPLQTSRSSSRFIHMQPPSLPPSRRSRSRPSVCGFCYLFGNIWADSQSVCAVAALLAPCLRIYPSRGDSLAAGCGINSGLNSGSVPSAANLPNLLTSELLQQVRKPSCHCLPAAQTRAE